MSKTTNQLFEEYCDRAHKANPAEWIIVSPQIAKQLNQIKKIKKWKKKK